MNALETYNGRLPDGRFSKGNGFSKGRANPIAAQVYDLKSAMLTACTPEQVTACTQRLLALCMDPDKKIALQAIGLLFDRLLGKPKEEITVETTTAQHQRPIDLMEYAEAEREQIRATLELIASHQTC